MPHYNTLNNKYRATRSNIIARCVMMLLLLVFGFQLDISAQTAEKVVETSELRRDAMRIRFVVAKCNINPNYMNNADSLKRIVEWIDKVQRDSMVDIVSVEFCGAVSPEGSVRFNHYLSNARLKVLERYVRSRIHIPEEIIVRNDNYIVWSELETMVENSDWENKDAILNIIRSENRSTGEVLDSRIGDLKRLDNGVTWMKLYRTFFADMRNAYTVIVTKKSQKAIDSERVALEPVPTRAVAFPEPAMKSLAMAPLTIAPPTAEMRNMYVKTNVVGLALLMGNVGVEFDMGRYFSFSLPVYYSALNYFSHTTKFRTFAIQPELRYWPMKNDDGLFIGAHMGFAYYNFAFNGAGRYQDRNGTTPTLGGGLTLGYRMPISKDDRWKLELGIGAGVYPLHYDVFHNDYNGALYDTRKKTYIGLDNILVGISYKIPLKKVTPKN